MSLTISFKGFYSLSVLLKSSHLCTTNSDQKSLCIHPRNKPIIRHGLWSLWWSQSVWTLLRMLLLAGCGCYFLQIHCFFLARLETPESAHYPYPDESPAQDGLNQQGVHHFPPLVAPQRRQPLQPQHTLLWTIDHAPSWALGRIGRTCGRWRWQGRP